MTAFRTVLVSLMLATNCQAFINIVGGNNQTQAAGGVFAQQLQVKLPWNSLENPPTRVDFVVLGTSTEASLCYFDRIKGATICDVQFLTTTGGARDTFSVTVKAGTKAPNSYLIKAMWVDEFKCVPEGDTCNAYFSLSNTVGAPAQVVAIGGGNQGTRINTAFASPLKARVLDRFGNLVSGVAVQFGMALYSGSAAGVLLNGQPLATVNTNSSGEATSPPIAANGVGGMYDAWAQVTGVATAAIFTLTNLVPIVITSVPTGVSLTFGHGTVTTPFTTDLAPGSVAVTAPSAYGAGAGTQYAFLNWADNVSTASRNIVAPTAPTTYTVNYQKQYQLTMSATAGGTVGPVTGWFNEGASVPITATPSASYRFDRWTGTGTGSYTGTQQNTNVTMSGPIQQTGAFLLASSGVTVTTSPPNLQIVVDGTTVTAPYSANWTNGSQHTIATPATQNGAIGTQYRFKNWSDGGAVSHTVTVGSTDAVYSAGFDTFYLLTTSVSPPGAGTVSPIPSSGDGYYLSGTTVQLTAQASSGYSFGNWSGDASGSTSSAPVVLSAARTAVANFSQLGSTTVTTSPAGLSVIVDGTTYTAPATFNWTAGTQHTLSVNSAQNGTGGQTYTFLSWSNGGAQAQTVTVSGSTNLFTANFQSNSPTGTGLRFVPLTPCRVMETRSLYNFEGRTGAFGPPALNGGDTRTLNLPVSNVCSIPSNAKAYVVNVTLIPTAGVNLVTLWPAGEARPDVWSIRSPDGQTVANSAIVKAGASGGISVYASDKTDLLIDISGYYTDSTAVNGLAFYPLTPCRVIDTRSLYRSPAGPFGPPSLAPQQARKFTFPATPYCSVPPAAAYSVTLTVAPPSTLAYLTLWPDGGAQPNVSSINSFAGRVLANSVIVPAASDGSIDVFASHATDLIVDINGYYAPDDGQNGLFYFPVTQCRANDSNTIGGIYADESSRTIAIPSSGCSGIPGNAKGYAINVTALPNGNAMPFLTAWPTGAARPNASILNAFQGQVVTNSAIVPAGTNGAIDVFAYRRTHVVVEVSGYFGR